MKIFNKKDGNQVRMKTDEERLTNPNQIIFKYDEATVDKIAIDVLSSLDVDLSTLTNPNQRTVAYLVGIVKDNAETMLTYTTLTEEQITEALVNYKDVLAATEDKTVLAGALKMSEKTKKEFFSGWDKLQKEYYSIDEEISKVDYNSLNKNEKIEYLNKRDSIYVGRRDLVSETMAKESKSTKTTEKAFGE